MIEYKQIDSFNPGQIQKIIKLSYEKFFDFFPNEKQRLYKQWELEDKLVFKNPESIGSHVLFTCLDGSPIGYFSWDDSHYPKGIIGQNCILPDYQQKGYGRKQIEIIIKIFENKKIKEIEVTTGEHYFFKPAQRLYESCGFKMREKSKGDLFDIIKYSRIANPIC